MFAILLRRVERRDDPARGARQRATRYDVAVTTGDAETGSTDFESDLRTLAGNLDAKVAFRAADDRDRRPAQLVDDGTVDVAVLGGTPPLVIVRSGENDTLVAFVRQALASRRSSSNLERGGPRPGHDRQMPARAAGPGQ